MRSASLSCPWPRGTGLGWRSGRRGTAPDGRDRMPPTHPEDEVLARAKTLEAVPFDTLVLWLSQLASQHGLRIESAQLENAGRAGTADARLSLERGGS